MSSEPVLLQCPEAVETPNLHFKALSKLKVSCSESFNSCTSLLAISQYYGLVFIGTDCGFLIIKSKEVFSAANPNKYYRKEVILNSATSHLAVDSEQKYLAVGVKQGPVVYVYDIASFLTKGINPIKTIPLAGSILDKGLQLCELTWQPNQEKNLTVCLSDGSVTSMNIFQGNGNGVFSLPKTVQARCLCWSPKGKQLVIGFGDGSLSQYKPDLKFVKKLAAPPIFNGSVTIVNILWISSFQFAAAYKDVNKADDFPIIMIVNALKNEPMKFINYEDITFSSMLYRPHQIYFYHQNVWNLIFVASANSIEVAVLHIKQDNLTWEQWLLGDASRAELPLNSNKVETFPVGFAIDYTSDQPVPWGEESLPPMPRLLLLSCEGLLTTFSVVNTTVNIPSICSPPKENFDDSWFEMKEEKQSDMKGSGVQLHSQTTLTIQNDSNSSENIKSLHNSGEIHVRSTSNFEGSTSDGSSNFKFQSSNQEVLSPVQQISSEKVQQMGKPHNSPQVATAQAISKTTPSKLSEVSSFGKYTPNTHGDKNQNNIKNEPNTNLDKNKTVFRVVSSTVELNKHSAVQENTPSESPPAAAKLSGSNSDANKLPSLNTSSATEQVKTLSTQVVSDEKRTRVKPSESNLSQSSPDIDVVDDSVYVTALLEEIDHFNLEMREVISRVSAININIGTQEEKLNLRNIIEKLEKFEKKLTCFTESQKNAMFNLKADVLEAFAWLEDAKSRNRQRKSRTFIQLKKSEELDPMSNRLMREIDHMKYYIENQLMQLYSYLMKEWVEHQDKCRLEIRTTMIIPSMEDLYKTLHLELKILSKQRSIVEELRNKVTETNGKVKVKPDDSGDQFNDVSNNRMSELHKLADNLLQIKIDRENKNDVQALDTFQLIIKDQINSISERAKKFTNSKQSILRDTFCEREMLKTRCVKPVCGSSSFVRNISSRMSSKLLVTPVRSDFHKSTNSVFPEFVSGNQNLTITKSAIDKKILESSENSAKQNECETSTREIPLPSVHESSFTERQEPAVPLFSFSSQSSSDRAKVENSKTLYTFSKSNVNNNVCAEAENVKKLSSEPSTVPFVFKAAPIISSGFNAQTTKASFLGFTVTNSPSSSGALNLNSAPSSNSDASVFSFKAEAPSTSSNTHSLFSGKITSAFSPKTQSQTIFSNSFAENSFTFSDIKQPTTSSFSTSAFSVSLNTPPNSSSLTFSTSSESNKNNIIFPFTSSPNASGFTLSMTNVASPGLVSSRKGSDEPSQNPATVTFSKSSPDAEKEVREIAEQGRTHTHGSDSETVTAVTTSTVNTVVSLITNTSSDVAIPPAGETTSSVVSAKNESGQQQEASKNEVPQLKPENKKSEENNVTKEEQTDVRESSSAPTSVGKNNLESSTTTSSSKNALFSQASTSAGFTTVVTSSKSEFSPITSGTVDSFASSSKTVFDQGDNSEKKITGIFSTTTSSIFSQTKVVTTSSSFFGVTSTTSSSNIFGQPITTTSSSANFFGQVTPTTSTTSFGLPAKDEIAQTTELFGDTLGTRSGNVFETPSNIVPGNIFSKTSFEKPSTNIFGNSPTTSTAATTGLFGTTCSNIFSKTTASFGQNMSSPSGSSVFGQPQVTKSTTTFMGQDICSSFGNSTTISHNQNPFASTNQFGNKAVFGQSIFGQASSGQNSFASSSIFGGSTSTTSGRSMYQSSTSTFGSASPGPFSSGASTIGQSSLGTNSAFQKPLGSFGSFPVLGNRLPPAPTFGAAPNFGGAPTFGAPPTFGNPQKVFGTPQGIFGQSQAQAPNFETLASQGADGFANLAQQSQSQDFGGSTFNSTAGFGREAFKGESFSDWRS